MKHTPGRKKRKAWWIAAAVLLLILAVPFGISGAMRLSVQDAVLTPQQAQTLDADCILVLGAGVWGQGEDARPSHMLADRLSVGLSLYGSGAAPKLLMSGDHGRKDYDEVNVMKDYAMEQGVPSRDVFMDHAGFSTYESLYRARDVFQAKRIIIVSQQYHLYRALYVARALGLEAYGVPADLRTYAGQSYYDLREVLARNKDFFLCIVQSKPTYLGEAIPVMGNGDLTNDERYLVKEEEAN